MFDTVGDRVWCMLWVSCARFAGEVVEVITPDDCDWADVVVGVADVW